MGQWNCCFAEEAFVDQADTDTAFIALLKRIASENGGVYRHVTQDEVR